MLSILKASDIITIYGKEIYEHIKSDIGEFKNITKEALSKYIPENVNVKKEITSDLSDISDKIRNSIKDIICNSITSGTFS
jgi:predicted transcriptional regulator